MITPKVATMKVLFSLGNHPQNGDCAKCFHPISRHGINAHNDDGKVHCWDCIGVGQEECITTPSKPKKSE